MEEITEYACAHLTTDREFDLDFELAFELAVAVQVVKPSQPDLLIIVRSCGVRSCGAAIAPSSRSGSKYCNNNDIDKTACPASCVLVSAWRRCYLYSTPVCVERVAPPALPSSLRGHLVTPTVSSGSRLGPIPIEAGRPVSE